ncbi:MAG: flagellar FliJ family protein [Gemmatimonadota bacterium]
MTDYKKLARVLDLRRHEEQRRAVELAMAREAVRDSEVALDQMRRQRAELEAELERLAGESVGQVKTMRLLMEQLDNGIHNALSVRALAAATEAEKLEALTKAAQNREALEKVVGPRREAALAHERQAEQKAIDDIITLRYKAGEG